MVAKSPTIPEKELGDTKETIEEMEISEECQGATSKDNINIEGEDNVGKIDTQMIDDIKEQEEGQDNNDDDNGPELPKDDEVGKMIMST